MIYHRVISHREIGLPSSYGQESGFFFFINSHYLHEKKIGYPITHRTVHFSVLKGYEMVALLIRCVFTRSGNFIIGTSGTDKQMLCASSGARAALNIAAEKSKQKR